MVHCWVKLWCTHCREESKSASTDPVFTLVLHKAGLQTCLQKWNPAHPRSSRHLSRHPPKKKRKRVCDRAGVLTWHISVSCFVRIQARPWVQTVQMQMVQILLHHFFLKHSFANHCLKGCNLFFSFYLIGEWNFSIIRWYVMYCYKKVQKLRCLCWPTCVY